MNYNLTPGISLDDRNLIANIPDDTEIEEFKYIAKVDENNYIAEDFIEVDGYDGKCSIGYIRYLENSEPHQGIFYLKNNSNAEINAENIIFPKKFGIITEINEDAVLYFNIMRKSNEKVYVIGEDLSKQESLDKNTIRTNIEESVRSYGVPNNSVIGFDGDENDIPNGYELTNESFGGGDTEVFICGEGQTIDDAPEEAKIIIDSNIVNAKPSEIVNSMEGNEIDKGPSVNAAKNYVNNRTIGIQYIPASQTSQAFTPSFDCYAEIYYSISGWAYGGAEIKPTVTCTQGNAELIADLPNGTRGHDTTPDGVFTMKVFKLKKGIEYKFSFSGMTGGTIASGSLIKLIPRYEEVSE